MARRQRLFLTHPERCGVCCDYPDGPEVRLSPWAYPNKSTSGLAGSDEPVLPSAAGQLGYILVEPLRGKFQALNRGEIREDGLTKVLGCHIELQRKHDCLN